MNKRGQGALEFLTTYGWAFLIVLVMIGALSSFGVFGNAGVDKCISGQGFTCDGSMITDQTQKFKFKNTLGEDVFITNATATIRSTGEQVNCSVSGGSVFEGDSFEVVCGGELSSGKRENVDVQFNYYSAESTVAYAKPSYVEVSGKVENYQNVVDSGQQTSQTSQECATLSVPNTRYELSSDLHTTGNCFTITADDVTLDCAGHTITGSITLDYFYNRLSDAITIQGADRATITNCMLQNFSQGVYVIDSLDSIITNNQIKDSFHGVHTLNGERIIVKENVFYNVTKYNIIFELGQEHKAYSNSFDAPVLQGNSRGVALTSTNTEVYNNDINKMGYALWTCCGLAQNDYFHDNNIVSTTFGILAAGGINNRFENNNIQDAKYGLYVWDMDDSNFTNNNLQIKSGTTYGIYFRPDANQNDNRFTNTVITGTPKYGVYINQNPNMGVFSKNNLFLGTSVTGATTYKEYIKQYDVSQSAWYTISSNEFVNDVVYNNTFQ
ncbi:hypothetical protein COV13_02520 [Candidatus Woesearchaeota archaeon CG10_big_fil_rev_8_21_14_0_10_32_9]|nr:MAG: hypothetical protein COV13_02520 [Candidatus Woesearchaeota archaeon CG10_big_fil_rev_8_21_14_0_10_32_9]